MVKDGGSRLAVNPRDNSTAGSILTKGSSCLERNAFKDIGIIQVILG